MKYQKFKTKRLSLFPRHLTLLNGVKPSLQTLYGDDAPDVKEAAEAGLKFR